MTAVFNLLLLSLAATSWIGKRIKQTMRHHVHKNFLISISISSNCCVCSLSYFVFVTVRRDSYEDVESISGSCTRVVSESYVCQYIRARWGDFDGAQLIQYRKWPHFWFTFFLCVIFAMMVNVQITRRDRKHNHAKHVSRADGTVISENALDFTLSTTGLWVCGTIVGLQIVEWILSLLVLIQSASRVGISDVWIHYISTAVHFGMVYYYMELASGVISPSKASPDNDPEPM